MQIKFIKPLLVVIMLTLLLSGCATQSRSIAGYGSLSHIPVTRFAGSNYVALDSLSRQYAFNYSTDNISSVIRIGAEGAIIKIMPESEIALIGDKTYKFSPSPKIYKGRILIAPSLAGFIADIKVKKAKEPIPASIPTIRTIVIDAGHGGRDKGALGYYKGLYEKNVVLDVAKRLRNKLNDLGNFNIIMTRDRDKFIPLWGRANIANKQKADLFISIHANAARSRRANGFEVFYLSNATDDTARAIAASENEVENLENKASESKPAYLNTTLWDMTLNENKKESSELARVICDISSRQLGSKNRGAKSARFYVLKYTRMPSVLVEIGFISNKIEAGKLNKAAYRQKISDSIASGVLSYKKEYERTEAFTKNVR